MELDTSKIDEAVLALLYLGNSKEIQRCQKFKGVRKAKKGAKKGVRPNTVRHDICCGSFGSWVGPGRACREGVKLLGVQVRSVGG